jgi:hypothetical protein
LDRVRLIFFVGVKFHIVVKFLKSFLLQIQWLFPKLPKLFSCSLENPLMWTVQGKVKLNPSHYLFSLSPLCELRRS